jgi:hypothetical protein
VGGDLKKIASDLVGKPSVAGQIHARNVSKKPDQSRTAFLGIVGLDTKLKPKYPSIAQAIGIAGRVRAEICNQLQFQTREYGRYIGTPLSSLFCPKHRRDGVPSVKTNSCRKIQQLDNVDPALTHLNCRDERLIAT